jgi:hypothetical protein
MRSRSARASCSHSRPPSASRNPELRRS